MKPEWILIPLFLLTACGNSATYPVVQYPTAEPCKDLPEITGAWKDLDGGMSYAAIGTGCYGYLSRCKHVFQFTYPDSAGDTVLTVEAGSATPVGCLTVGDHNCQFIELAGDLQIDCGAVKYNLRRP